MLPFGARRTPPPDWRKATFCQSGECVEVAQHNGMIIMRDANRLRRRPLRYTTEEWSSFVSGVKAGEFDDLVGQPQRVATSSRPQPKVTGTGG